jgi:hypothetical protein
MNILGVEVEEKAESVSSQGIQTDSRNPNKDSRPPRVPMGQSMNLEFAGVKRDEANYKYYAFLDQKHKPGRVQKALAAYWEYVTYEDGTNVVAPAGDGLHYLMKLPREYWEQDLLLKKKAVARRIDAENSIGDEEYAPDSATGRPEGGKTALHSGNSDNPYS